MSILTISWSMAGAMCITFALIHLFIWFRQRGVIAHLLFSFAALGAAGCAFSFPEYVEEEPHHPNLTQQ